MAKKRPRRPQDTTRGPRPLQASKLPDRRPPKRGKSGSPLASGNAKSRADNPSSGAPTGTSQSGRPIKPALDPSTVASSPAPTSRGRSKGPRERKSKPPKKASYVLLTEASAEGGKAYAMLEDLVALHHHHLVDASIALAFNRTWKPDGDGHVTLGRCKRATDLDRELAPYDFVILLRQDFWQDRNITDDQRRALLDHELCHADVKLDEDGELVRDEKDRVVYRTRKHDIEEFAAIVLRHGVYTRDIERFYTALKSSRQQKLPFFQPQMPEKRVARAMAEENAGKNTPTVGQTNAALGEIAKHVGGNGQEPRPSIDDTKAGAVRMAAATSGAVDDIERAARADAEAHP